MVRDEINSTGENDIYCFMHTDAEITINGDEAILSKNGKQLRVQFNEMRRRMRFMLPMRCRLIPNW